MSIPKPLKYIADFEQMGFGLFVHWGLYSQMGKGEWIFDNIDMPMEEYMKLKDTFTAEDFDADKLCLFARHAGCKYIILTTNNHWGFGANDINHKSPAELIENLCDSRKVGANYLLNIGPMGQGAIDPYHVELFNLISRWMGHFGEAIYNGRPYGAKCFGKNFILKSADGKSLYIFVYELDTGGSVDVMVGGKYKGAYGFSGMKDEIKSLKWMDNGEDLKFIQGNGMLCFDATGYEYGKSLVVRVAKAEIE